MDPARAGTVDGDDLEQMSVELPCMNPNPMAGRNVQMRTAMIRSRLALACCTVMGEADPGLRKRM